MNLLVVPKGQEYRNVLGVFVFVTNFQHMRSFVSYAHVTSGLVAPFSDLVIFGDAVQGYIKEAGAARLRMWDLIFFLRYYRN